ncbi:MAG TPA: phosphonate C-P lyase system protein PhnH, partial [Tepidisphaeraceae bacterium]|nr:phosphonate C-P lyase system protein PhnH [Tepidisphaeraceae bacterium]
ATVVLRADAVGAGELTIEVVAGPGVEMPRRVRLAGVAVEWFHRRAEWVADFPLGVDLILADERRVVAFPRTTALRIDRA